ncbi:MAG: hypothetical protein BHV69_00850 [Bacteroidales bacterium 52_46]|nr:MAG: hypothetical protein BHV69_00850 [Bacteroidales bacterium 52_46]
MMTTSYTDIQHLFEQRRNNPLFNTSYPLSPDDWAKYSTQGSLPFDPSKPIAFYIHIPFCKQICSFCEYTKMCVPSKEMQRYYFNALISDIECFVGRYPNIEIYGLDIGGGTPTSVNAGIFAGFISWLSEFISDKKMTADFEPSIEGSFNTLVDDYWGSLRSYYIARAGIKRLSLGVQSTSNDVLKPLHRNIISLKEMREAMVYWHNLGIEKINLDLMYGLPGQSIESVQQELTIIRELSPEQVTIYEFRTNQIKGSYRINPELCFQQYCELYAGLTNLGYYSKFGRNTFSKLPDDCGLSSYLRHRMFDGWQYKGFGISAQSMSYFGVSYNQGKNQTFGKLVSKEWLQNNNYSYESLQHYKLPRQELLSKFIAISGYSGGFSLSVAKDLFGANFYSNYQNVIDFIIVEDLATIKDDRLQLTEKGFRYYGATLSLFFK